MFLSVALPISSAAGTLRRSSFIRTMSADSMAMSVPEPTAIPTSAWVSAGASLIPSPVIATRLWATCRSLTISSLSPGFVSAWTSSMPSSEAMCSAVSLLSPVTIITLRPSLCIDSMAEGLSSRTGSEIATVVA